MSQRHRAVTRREILKLGLLSLAGLALPAGALAADWGGSFTREKVREELEDVLKRVGQAHNEETVRETATMSPFMVLSDNEEVFDSPPHAPFSQDLPFPPLAVPDSTTFPSKYGPADHYTIVQRVGQKSYFPGLATPIWGFNGIHPGPTILAQFGKPVVVTQVNELPGGVITHLHGAHLAPEDDGNALDNIPPGQRRDFHYPNRPHGDQGSTLWYHDHREEVTSPHLYLGLAAFYLLNDQFEEGLRAARLLPSGIAGTVPREQAHDIPLVIQDRRFAPDGRLFFQLKPGDKGNLGDKFLVNGAIQPKLEVATRKYRFRVLNGSPARDWNLALSNGMPFTQIGTDGGLMSRPVELRNLLISVSERYEVIIDFSKVKVGSRVHLMNLFGNELWKEDDPVPIMRFDVVREEKDDVVGPPNPLRTLNPLVFPEPSRAVAHRTFRFERRGGLWVINDLTWDHDRDDATPVIDTVEIWDLINKSGGWVHPIHIHEEHFRVWSHTEDENELHLHNAPNYEALGHKDTVRLGSNEKARVIKFFGPEKPGRFVFHCHNSDHEDHHMMGVFNVVPR